MNFQTNNHSANIGIVLPAGGKGLRLGGEKPKQFRLLKGKPMLVWTIEAFHHLPEVKCVMLVLPKELIGEWKFLCDSYPKLRLCEGGKERWESVRNGVLSLPTECSGVLVHDVARPFVETAWINSCMEQVLKGLACIVAQPATDTIKKITGDQVQATLDRRELILVQTPQGFPVSMLKNCYSQKPWWNSDSPPTDESALVEGFGFKVGWVPGGFVNKKITEAADWDWATWMAESLHRQRESKV